MDDSGGMVKMLAEAIKEAALAVDGRSLHR